MTRRIRLLVAMKALVDELIELEQASMPQIVDPLVCPQCGAGAELQKDRSTFGTKRVICGNCRFEREL